MKMWIARTPNNGLYIFINKPFWREDLKLWCERIGRTTESGRLTAGYIFDSDLFPEVTFENSPMEIELVIKSKMKALELFKKFPHLDYYKNVLIDWGYTPSLCHFDMAWHVGWVHCEEGDILVDFEGNTPEEAIKKAFDWCVELKLIEK